MGFGTGLHIMLALAYHEGERVSSSDLASSVDVNPVTARRVIADLAASGLLDTQTGPGGGARLARSASKITVQDIYEALGEPPFIEGHSKDPVAKCAVSVCMPRVFDRLNDEVTKKASAILRKTTLQKLLDQDVEG